MTSFLRRGAGGRPAPFCGICTKWRIFRRQTLCKMTNKKFLKSLVKFRTMWYNINVVKGRGKPKSRRGSEQNRKNF